MERVTSTAETVARAAQLFVTKLDRLAPAVDNAFAVGALHGFIYHGETWEAELNQLKDALRAWEADTPPRVLCRGTV